MTAPAAPSDPPLSPAARWRALHPGARALLAVAAGVLAVNAALAGLEAVTGSEPGGPASSSYATAPEGMAAFAELLHARGHPVGRHRTDLDRASLDPAATLVVADLDRVGPEEAAALARFVGEGGRLVATGRTAGLVAAAAVGGGPAWAAAPATPARPLAPVAEVTGVERVVSAGTGSWAGTGPMLPVLASRGAVLAAVASVGQGRVVAIADSSLLQNRLLTRADNAAFGLAAVGEEGRPVRFAEAHHGYGTGKGFAALPGRWRWALAGLVVAVLVWMWARGRRLGPPEDLERPMSPPRRAYVDAIAATLARSRRPAQAMAPLQAAARRRLAQRGALAPDAGDDDLRQAGARLGLAPDEVAALLRPVTTDDRAVAAGRALAHLEVGAR